MLGLIFWLLLLFPGDTSKRMPGQMFATSVSVQSDDASQVFRTFDLDLKYELKSGKRQFEIADEFGISMYHGGIAHRHRDRFVIRISAQAGQDKITGTTNLCLEGPLFPKRDLMVDPIRGRYLTDSKGCFMNPSQLVANAGIRFVVFKGATMDMSFPSLMLYRLSSLGAGPSSLQRELIAGESSVVYYATGATAIFNLNKSISKSLALDCRSLLFFNGYRFKYQQWNQELRLAWKMRKNVEWILQVRLSEDRTVFPRVMKWYSLRLGYRVGWGR